MWFWRTAHLLSRTGRTIRISSGDCAAAVEILASSFLFEAHPASTVYAGPIFWELKNAARMRRDGVNAVRAALPKPIIDFAGPIPYTALQGMFDGLYPKGLQ